MYSVIFCGILLRAPEVSQTQRRTAINSAIGNSLTVIPILVYQVLLADKLDGDLRSLKYSIVSIPLFIGLFSLILLSFNSKGGNKCKSIYFVFLFFLRCIEFHFSFSIFIAGWFGIRKNFSQFLLSTLPCLQEYGNIGYHSTRNRNDNPQATNNSQTDESEDSKAKDALKRFDHLKPVMPIVSIDMPD